MLHQFSLFINRIVEVFVVILASLMTIVILLGVFFRYVLLKPLPWSEDLGRYLMIWLALFAVGLVMHHRRHVAVRIFVDLLPSKMNLLMRLLANSIVVVFAILMGVLGIQYLSSAMSQISPSLHIDLWWVYLGFPFFSFFLVISTLDQMCQDVANYKNGNEQDI